MHGETPLREIWPAISQLAASLLGLGVDLVL